MEGNQYTRCEVMGMYIPPILATSKLPPKALLKMIFLFTRSGYVSSLEGSRLNTFILHRNGRNWPGVVWLMLRVVEKKSPPRVANGQPPQKKLPGPRGQVCRLTGSPDAKTRATAIQALTEMGERGACFEEEVWQPGNGGTAPYTGLFFHPMTRHANWMCCGCGAKTMKCLFFIFRVGGPAPPSR